MGLGRPHPMVTNVQHHQIGPGVEPTREEDKEEAEKHLDDRTWKPTRRGPATPGGRSWKPTRRGPATPGRSWGEQPRTEDAGEQSLMAYATGGAMGLSK